MVEPPNFRLEEEETNRKRDEFIEIHREILHLFKHPDEEKKKELRKKISRIKDEFKNKYRIVDGGWRVLPIYDETKKLITEIIARTNHYENLLNLPLVQIYEKRAELENNYHFCVHSFNKLAGFYGRVIHVLRRVA